MNDVCVGMSLNINPTVLSSMQTSIQLEYSISNSYLDNVAFSRLRDVTWVHPNLQTHLTANLHSRTSQKAGTSEDICSNQLSVVLCQTKHLHSSVHLPVVSAVTHWS